MKPRLGTSVTVLVVGAFVLVAGLGAAVLAGLVGGDEDEAPSPAVEYDDAGVPWWDGRKVHWAGRAVPEDDVASYTATRDAAVFLHDRPQYPEQPGPQGLGRLTALFADGSTEELATRVVGVPMADPAGRIVAWTVQVDDHTATLSAYDTAERVHLGTRPIEVEDSGPNVVSAVVGDTVYVSSGRRALAWHPLEPESEPAMVDGLGPGTGLVIGGTDDGLLIAGEGFGVSWLGAEGAREPVDASLGTLSPDGRFLVTGTDDEDNDDHVIVSVPAGDLVALDLPKDRKIYQARWAGDGTLVAATVEKGQGWDDGLDVTSYACDVDAGTCRRLTGGPAYVGALALFEDNFLGQFLVAYEAGGLN